MIYLDNNATTPIAPEVVSCMQEIYHLGPLNPSSVHSQGKRAKEIVLQARDRIASYFQVDSQDLYFTSSSTEGLTTLIRGFVQQSPGATLLSSKIEHNAIDQLLNKLIQEGTSVNFIPSTLSGAPTLESIQACLTPQTKLAIFSSVYSETGSLLPIEEVAAFFHQKGIHLLIDATAHIGKAPFIVYPGISAFTLSAHKFHGPQGVGMMYAHKNFPFQPLLIGGYQEQKKRAGTENVAGIVGLKMALELIEPKHFSHMQLLTDRLTTQLSKYGTLNSAGARISNTCNFAFPDFDAETLLIRLDRRGICLSMGSACSSGSIEPSRVLLEMGLARTVARSSLRFSVSRMNTSDEIEQALEIFQEEFAGCIL